jgi:hypothetical protein
MSIVIVTLNVNGMSDNNKRNWGGGGGGGGQIVSGIMALVIRGV